MSESQVRLPDLIEQAYKDNPYFGTGIYPDDKPLLTRARELGMIPDDRYGDKGKLWLYIDNISVRDIPAPNKFSLRSWLFSQRVIYRKGIPFLFNTKGNDLLIGDRFYRVVDGWYFVIKSLGPKSYDIGGQIYKIAPARWQEFLAKHPKVNYFVAKYRAAKYAWDNPEHTNEEYEEHYYD